MEEGNKFITLRIIQNEEKMRGKIKRDLKEMGFSKSLIRFVLGCLDVNPKKRWDAKEALNRIKEISGDEKEALNQIKEISSDAKEELNLPVLQEISGDGITRESPSPEYLEFQKKKENRLKYALRGKKVELEKLRD